MFPSIFRVPRWPLGKQNKVKLFDSHDLAKIYNILPEEN